MGHPLREFRRIPREFRGLPQKGVREEAGRPVSCLQPCNFPLPPHKKKKITGFCMNGAKFGKNAKLWSSLVKCALWRYFSASPRFWSVKHS